MGWDLVRYMSEILIDGISYGACIDSRLLDFAACSLLDSLSGFMVDVRAV